jgi:hypothetical protein
MAAISFWESSVRSSVGIFSVCLGRMVRLA